MKYVAAGSLSREVDIYPVDQSVSVNKGPTFHITMNGSIRSLAFHPTKPVLLIGLMTGEIFQWRFHPSDKVEKCDRPKEPAPESESAVTALKFAPAVPGRPPYLIASYTSGEIEIFRDVSTGDMCALENMYTGLVHPPDSPSENFGSLGDYAEIWSAAWSCEGTDRFATVSEDQTCRVWRFSEEFGSVSEVPHSLLP